MQAKQPTPDHKLVLIELEDKSKLAIRFTGGFVAIDIP